MKLNHTALPFAGRICPDILRGLPVLAGLLCGALFAVPVKATSVGPGKSITGATISDVSYNLINVDTANVATLGPGTYLASQFNYVFTSNSGDSVGSITPIVVIESGTNNFIPVAVGSTIDYDGAISTSTAFAGSDVFTLTSTTTIYGGFYWDDTSTDPTDQDRSPIDFNVTGGSTFQLHGNLNGNVYTDGANAPLVGTPDSTGPGGHSDSFTRAYDFGIDVVAVPLPNSLWTGGMLMGLCIASRVLKQRTVKRAMAGTHI